MTRSNQMEFKVSVLVLDAATVKISKLQDLLISRNDFFLSLLFPDTPLPFMSYILVYSDNPGRNTEEIMARVTNMED